MTQIVKSNLTIIELNGRRYIDLDDLLIALQESRPNDRDLLDNLKKARTVDLPERGRPR